MLSLREVPMDDLAAGDDQEIGRRGSPPGKEKGEQKWVARSRVEGWARRPWRGTAGGGGPLLWRCSMIAVGASTYRVWEEVGRRRQRRRCSRRRRTGVI